MFIDFIPSLTRLSSENFCAWKCFTTHMYRYFQHLDKQTWTTSLVTDICQSLFSYFLDLNLLVDNTVDTYLYQHELRLSHDQNVTGLTFQVIWPATVDHVASLCLRRNITNFITVKNCTIRSSSTLKTIQCYLINLILLQLTSKQHQILPRKFLIAILSFHWN